MSVDNRLDLTCVLLIAVQAHNVEQPDVGSGKAAAAAESAGTTAAGHCWKHGAPAASTLPSHGAGCTHFTKLAASASLVSVHWP